MTFRPRVAGLALMIAVTPAVGGAQTVDAPRLTIGGAGGISNPLHGDIQYVAPSWEVSVRGQVARRLAIEGFMSQWRHSTETVRSGVSLNGPGPMGRIAEVAVEDNDRVSMVGFTFQPTFPIGRMIVAAGGGPAMMIFRSDYAQRLSGCEAAIAAVCGTYGTQSTNGTFAVHFAGSLDVRLASRVTTFGQFRAGFPTQDPGSGHYAVSGGLRFVLR